MSDKKKSTKNFSLSAEGINDKGSLAQRDQKHIWHPLTQHKLSTGILPIVKAKGAILYDENGKEYIDGIASWYTCMYGHCNEHITKKSLRKCNSWIRWFLADSLTNPQLNYRKL